MANIPYYDIDLFCTGSNIIITSPNSEFSYQFAQTKETIGLDSELYNEFLKNAISRFRKSPTYKSYKSHIESGYKTPTEFEIVSEQISNIESIYLADLRYMIFYPQSMPINKGTYDINIHIVLEDEREINYPVKFTFK